MPFKALIVDDESLARDELKYLLLPHRECQIIGEASDGFQALRMVDKLQPEVVFLDIGLGSMSGYEAAAKMLSIPMAPLIIFVTAYDKYAVHAFELGVVDYLLKPVESQRLEKTLERINAIKSHPVQWEEALSKVTAIVKNQMPSIRKLPVEKEGMIRLLDHCSIVYCRAQDGQILVFSKKDIYFSSVTMNELESKLGEAFLRVHKSYLINLSQIAGILPWFKGTYWLIMNDAKQTKIPVGKGKVKQLKAKLGLD
jgi:DNA-binding LytR/AlgR family response regulator